MNFEWDINNIFHVARHNLTTEQIENIFISDKSKKIVPSDVQSRYIALCMSNGKLYCIIFIKRIYSVRVITAFRTT